MHSYYFHFHVLYTQIFIIFRCVYWFFSFICCVCLCVLHIWNYYFSHPAVLHTTRSKKYELKNVLLLLSNKICALERCWNVEVERICDSVVNFLRLSLDRVSSIDCMQLKITRIYVKWLTLYIFFFLLPLFCSAVIVRFRCCCCNFFLLFFSINSWECSYSWKSRASIICFYSYQLS